MGSILHHVSPGAQVAFGCVVWKTCLNSHPRHPLQKEVWVKMNGHPAEALELAGPYGSGMMAVSPFSRVPIAAPL